jgi:hypothetical protein
LTKAYTAIYPDTLTGDRLCYCTVTLSDSAKNYTNSDIDSSEGNTTSAVYFYDDVYGYLQSTKTISDGNAFGITKGMGLDASAIKTVLNGTYSGSLTDTEKKQVLAVLSAKETDTLKSYLPFKINPAANPKYKVIGYDYTKLSTITSAAKNQTGITVSIVSGLDNAQFKPSDITVYQFGPYLKSDFTTDDSLSSLIKTIYSDPASYASADTTKAYLLQKDTGTSSVSATSANISITLSDKIKNENYYVIAASGKDSNDVELDSDSQFAFEGIVSGTLPKLVISAPVNYSVHDSSQITFTGTASSADSFISKLSYKVNITDEADASDNPADIAVTEFAAPGTASSSWSFSLAPDVASGKQYLYSVTVIAEDQNGKTTEKDVNVHIDTTAPVVKITSAAPVVKSDSATFVNGTVTVSGTVDEVYLNSLRYDVYIDGSMTASAGASLPVSHTFSMTIDTTKFADGKSVSIVVTATDDAGNTGTYSTRIYNSVTYSRDAELFIEQSTDKPVITLSNAKTSVAQDKISKSNGNLFNTSDNRKLLGTVTDDDGIKTITSVVYSGTGFTAEKTLTQTDIAATPTTYSYEYQLPSDEGIYKVVITAVDTKYTSDSETPNNTQSAAYYVAIDKGAPTFTIITANNAYAAAGKTKTVTGTASDSNGIKSITRYSDPELTSSSASPVTTPAGISWTDTFNTGDTGATYYYVAEDSYGNTTQLNFTYKVDAVSPTFTIATVGSASYTGLCTVYAVTENICRIQGTVSDSGTDASGVKGIYYCIRHDNAPDGNVSYEPLSGDTTSSGWTACGTATTGTTTTWTANLDLSSTDETKTYTVYIAAADEAGNISTIAGNPSNTVSVVPDAAVPSSTLAVQSGKVYAFDGKTTVSSFENGISYYAAGAFTLGGTITETHPDSAKLSYSRNSGAVTSASFSSFDEAAGTWTYNQEKTDGSYTYTLTLSDKAGRTASYTFTVIVDSTPPELTVKSPAAGESFDKTAVFNGTAPDALSGLETVTYTLKQGSTVIGTADTPVTVTGSSWSSGEINFAGTSPSYNEGTYTLILKATDLIGNTTADTSVAFYYDKAPPSLTETSVGVSGMTTNTLFTLSGKASDTNALAAYISGASGPVTVTDTVITTDDKTSSAKTYLNVASDGTWTKDFTKGSVADGTHVFTITATDAAGKQTQLSRTVTVDTKNPEISSASFTTEKYGSTEWFNTTSLKITVAATDTAANTNTGAATGVSAVAYSTDYGTVTDKSDANWISLTRGTSAWNGTVSASDGTNTVYFMANDAAGNSTVWNSSLEAKVDTTKPTACTVTLVKNGDTQLTATELASLLADSTSLLVNKTKDVTITVKPADSGSGAASVKCGTASGSANGDGTYTITIAKDNLATGSLSAVVTDTAGNSETFRLFPVQVDSAAPVVKIASPDENSTVNKEITLSGTASDAVSLGNVYLSIKTTGGYTKLNGGSPLTVTDTNWSYTLDTTAYDSTGTDTAVSIKLTAEDAAGNSSETERAFTVNQNSDRPVLILSNIKSSGTLLKSKTVYGTVTDDDGTIKGLWYTTDATLAAGTTVPTTADDKGWTKITVSNGSWSADSSGGDGDTTWYFYVIDGAGGLFTTKASSALERPYITDSAAEKQDNTTGVSFKVDTVAPEIQTMALSRAATGTTTGAKEYNADTSNVWITTNNTSFGGNYGILYAKVTVYEQTGMDSTAPAVLSTDTAITPVLVSTVSNVYTYVIGPLDFTKKSGESYVYADGTLSVSVTAKDAAGTTNVKSLNVIVDNTAPSVSVTYPGTTSSDAVTSTVTMKGTAADNAGGSGVARLYYRIPKISGDVETWTELSGTAAWEIPFTSTETGNAMNILTYANATYAASYGASGLWKVPVYFKMTDELGNTATDTSHYIVADSEGGKPTAEIIYPALTAGGENPTAGGTINVYGTATDDVAVVTVRVQLDVNGDRSYDSSDYTLISGWTGTAVCSALTGTASDWYILASGTNSWKLAVDSSKLSSGVTTIGMRVCAYDAVPQTRGWTDTLTVKIDKDVPQIGSPNALKVVQYASGSSGTTTLEREYSSGMYISSSAGNGNWYLTGSCSDDQCVSSFVLKTVSSSSATYISCDWEKTKMDASQYDFSIPLDTSKDGQIYSLLTITDNKGASSQQYININIDSTAPAMYERSGDTVSDKDVSTSVKANLQDKLRLVSSSETLSKDNPIVNSNTVYTFGDTVTEAGSGLKYIAFYMERVGAAESRVYCPMYNASTTEKTSNKTVINTGITSSTAAGDVYINTDGLAVLYATDMFRSAADSFTSDTIKSNYNVRKGGLIKIGGAYSRITTVDNTSGIVTFSPTVSTTFTTAEIVYAQVVDHMLTEGPTGTDYTKVQNDDGDGMIESLSNAGSSYTWSASIFSDRIPDGPVQVHVVVIDDAGNVNNGYVTTSIQNSRPKLTKVILGTDLNLDKSISESEEVTYSTIVNNAATASAEIDALSDFTAKSTTEIIPEIVGGNGTLYYVWDYWTASDWGTKQTGSSKPTALTTTDGETTVNGKKVATRTAPISLAVTDEKLAGKVSDGEAKLVYTFWDSTEETTPGTDSQYATLSIALNVDVVDDTCPKTVISPFYWNSLNNNSIYGSDEKSGNEYVVQKTSQLAGHIELEDDWKNATGYDSTATSGEYDGDAKVSGQIVVRGTAYDDHLITALYMTIDGFTFPNADTSTTPSAAQFGFAANGKRTDASSGKTYYQVATCSKGTWTNSDYWSSYGWKFTAATKTLDESGHTVTWELDWDTSKLSTIAGADKVIRIIAEDARSVPNASSEVAVTGNTPLYQVDVVPYITGITTGLATKSSSNPTVFTRTSDGHYSVREKESITVKGFNFATTSAPKMTVYTSHDATPASENISATTSKYSTTSATFALDSAVVSGSMGAFTVTYESDKAMVALNNSNLNTAEYNKQPNKANNNLLTDDVYFDVWQFTTIAEPAVSALKKPTVKISPSDGMIGASFANLLFFNMAGKRSSDETSGKSASCTQTPYVMSFNGCDDNTFTFDSNGWTYGSVQYQANNSQAKSGYFQMFAGTATQVSKFSLYGNYANWAGACRLEANAITLKESSTAAEDWITNLYRITSPVMVAVPSSEKEVTVYMAYADTTTHQIRFRKGRVNPTGTPGTGTYLYSTATKDSLRDIIGDDYSGANQGSTSVPSQPADSPRLDRTNLQQRIHVVANSGATLSDGSAGAALYSNSSYTTTYGAGEYVALGVTKNGTVVLAWHDGDADRLIFTYNTAPDAGDNNTTYKSLAGGSGAEQWQKNAVVLDEGGGQNVQMVVDSDDHIHLAYYSDTAGDLKYAYISSYTAAGSAQKAVVDSYLDVGEHCTLNVAKNGDNQVPFIGYYSNKCAKQAYRVDFTEGHEAGAVSDKFTGYWNISYVPSTSSTISEDRVNIGVWTKTDGTLQAIPSGTDIYYDSDKAGSNVAGKSSRIYANGTDNPIVAYINKAGALEMAQMK